jgi:prepilin-type N-terminal cleavage/methylation domain-containing protein
VVTPSLIYKGKRLKRDSHKKGFSLVEALVATVVVAVAALCALSFEYLAAGQIHYANAQIHATRIAKLLLEDWKSTGGSDTYDPCSLGLGFIEVQIPINFSEGQGLGIPLNGSVYAIQVDEYSLMLKLMYIDVATDTATQVTLRQLAVIGRLGKPGDNQTMTSQERFVKGPQIYFVTYVRRDASGG